ncbi:MAG TPA: aromatic acid/H+ symport family MFS transporter [Stellaceae bacterium]|jgi:AAHS family 4-hydroxybenzoate transporter-like MFS transporter|nr:aromatic acid/H+ symport family MFS transporter [Stellaceae bacterium]
MSHSVGIQGYIDANPFSSRQWLIFLLCLAVVLLDGFDTASIGYIAPSLLNEWHVPKPALAPVLSAALFGFAGGAICAGPLADRFGRKSVLIATILLFGIACFASASASSLDQLVTWRFITGLGLGAAGPCAVTMIAECSPSSRRSLITNAMFCGFPVGAACGGFLAAWMIPHWGWRSVLEAGGTVPVILALIMLVAMPESARYLGTMGRPAGDIGRALGRITGRMPDAAAFVVDEAKPAASGGSIGLILSRDYIVGTLMLWVTYFMGLVIFYGTINWMPILLQGAGLPPGEAGLITALFPLGGFGAILSGWLMDRFNGNKIIAICFALTAVTVFFIGQLVSQLWLLVAIVFIAGALMNTAQSSLPALAATFYPTQGRATGVAWMQGVGRFGGIAGSFLVADLTARHLGFASIFIALAVPGLIAAGALLVKQAIRTRASQAREAA